MKIREIHQKEIWEKFRFRYSPEAFFQSWLWGEVLQKQHTKIQRLGFFDHSGVLTAIAQVAVVAARRGKFLHVRHGPISRDSSAEWWSFISSSLRAFSKKESCWFVRISPLLEISLEKLQFFKNFGFVEAAIHAMDAEHCWVLDLAPPVEEILGSMRKTTRYEIKRAEKLGVTVTKTTNTQDLSQFIELYKETAIRQGFVGHGGIREEFEIFEASGQMTLYLGNYEGRVYSGAIIIDDGDQAIYHHGASLYSKIPVSYAVQWEAIKDAKMRGKKIYNFWGIAPDDKPNHPWRGITLFKTGFGGRKIEYIHALDLPISSFYYISRSIELLRRLKKGY